MTVAPSTTGADYALQTEKISKRFAAVTAVDQLSISVLRGKITSIVGPNGSGKSTLVNLLSGMLPLDGGIVVIEGSRFSVVRAHETPDHGITRTFQEVRLFDQITVWDNIMVVLTQRRLFPAMVERTKRSHTERAREILETVGMWEKRRSLAMDLSYGQRKLLEIGRAMALSVSIYLFDEPYAGLFPQMVERVKVIMKQMRDDGRTLIFISPQHVHRAGDIRLHHSHGQRSAPHRRRGIGSPGTAGGHRRLPGRIATSTTGRVTLWKNHCNKPTDARQTPTTETRFCNW